MSRKRAARRIVIVGGGSASWGPDIVRDMLLTPSIADSEFVLFDTNPDASALVCRFLRNLNTLLRTPARIITSNDRARAFRGAEYFVITISTGGLHAMAHDLAIPEEYGIYHTVGDTAGPGGWARAVRNVDAFVSLAHDINRYAPGAVVLNYSNPMTALTGTLAGICTGPVVGLCHGLHANLDFIQNYYGLDDGSRISANYGGINHFFWIDRLRVRGRDALDELRTAVRRTGITTLVRKASSSARRERRSYDLATELFRETGIMPHLADRHTCEFFPCYITNQETMKRFHLVRTTIADRRQALRERTSWLRRLAGGEIPESETKRSRESASDFIAAHVTGRSFVDVGNLPNVGQVSNLPPATIVETAVRVDGNGFAAVTFGALPPQVAGLVEPYSRLIPMTVEACLRRDREQAIRALRLDPVCSHLAGAEVREMALRLLRANRDYTLMSA